MGFTGNSMKSITFFSYKGGVGRTLAAVNFAIYASRSGRATAIVDFDLDAPGVDSKFGNLVVDKNKPGLLDYILDYQATGQVRLSISDIAVRVPLPEEFAPLWVLPAGQYLEPTYFAKLRDLDWERLFSEGREGVAFFQHFLTSLQNELNVDLAVIDSRAGVSEIAGLCTQQLGDEIVMLTSLAAESVRVTKHLITTIEKSELAKALNKAQTIKIVVTRVPKPKDIPTFHEQLAKRLDVDPKRLFFLFSCRALESEEFLALSQPMRDQELTDSYLTLFGGLDVRLSDQRIRQQLDEISRELLLRPPVEVGQRLKELAVLFPHPEVYKALLRFYRLTQNRDELRSMGWRILDIVHEDKEVEDVLAESYAQERFFYDAGQRRAATKALMRVHQRQGLDHQVQLKLADLLEDEHRWKESLEIALPLASNEDKEISTKARQIAIRDLLKLSQTDQAVRMATELPIEDMPVSVAPHVMEEFIKSGDGERALRAMKIAVRRPEYLTSIVKVIRNVPDSEQWMKELKSEIRRTEWWSEMRAGDRRIRKLLHEAGISDAV